VRGWPLGLGERARLQRRLRRLGNIVLRDPAADMRAVYRQTRILLVPSQWEAETWGRVVTEAQFSGIPVVASNRGGLPESVGPGGVVLEYDQPAPLWAEAIRRLWVDGDWYRGLSQAALDHSARPAIDPDRQVTRLIGALEQVSATSVPR
jgi:glycosyltransferase involved in cell wall biosynthesis